MQSSALLSPLSWDGVVGGRWSGFIILLSPVIARFIVLVVVVVGFVASSTPCSFLYAFGDYFSSDCDWVLSCRRRSQPFPPLRSTGAPSLRTPSSLVPFGVGLLLNRLNCSPPTWCVSKKTTCNNNTTLIEDQAYKKECTQKPENWFWIGPATIKCVFEVCRPACTQHAYMWRLSKHSWEAASCPQTKKIPKTTTNKGETIKKPRASRMTTALHTPFLGERGTTPQGGCWAVKGSELHPTSFRSYLPAWRNLLFVGCPRVE